MPKNYTLKPQVTPLPGRDNVQGKAQTGSTAGAAASNEQPANDPFVRAEAEDDDGYDPYSDRPPTPEPLFQENPWD